MLSNSWTAYASEFSFVKCNLNTCFMGIFQMTWAWDLKFTINIYFLISFFSCFFSFWPHPPIIFFLLPITTTKKQHTPSTTEVYHLTIPEAGSPSARCWVGWLLLILYGSFSLSPCSHKHPNGCLCLFHIGCFSESKLPFSIRTADTGLEQTLCLI